MRQFQTVAFRLEFEDKETALARWTTPPEIGAYGDGPAFRRLGAWSSALIDDAENATGLKWTFNEDVQQATLKIAMLPRAYLPEALGLSGQAEFQAEFRDSVCAFRFHGSEAYEINRAIVVIDMNLRDSLLRHCFAEELVQSLGLPNDACLYRPSLFCEQDQEPAMTPADRVLLRTLYDPRLRPGMTREEAMPIARRIIAELWPQ